jgi:hypothetical protein
MERETEVSAQKFRQHDHIHVFISCNHTCVVACGRQQKAASTESQLTSSILTREGTSEAPARWGNTSENGLPA